MLLTRRIHPVLGREELTQVGGPFRRGAPSSAASEEAPRRHATALDALPYLPALTDSPYGNTEGWFLF